MAVVRPPRIGSRHSVAFGLVVALAITLTTSISASKAVEVDACSTPGILCAWGDGDSGALGRGDQNSSPVPVPVTGLSHVAKVAASTVTYNHNFAYALLEDGTVWSWGYGAEGQLGTGGFTRGSIPPSFVPQQIPSLTNIVDVAAGSASGFGYALRSDGTVWAWGAGDEGQLGNSFGTWSSVPIQIGGLSNIVAVAAAQQTGFALRSDGTVWALGSAYQGILGNGTTGSAGKTYVPVQVNLPPNIRAIAAGSQNAYALGSDSTVWAWGNCTYGALGNPSLPCEAALYPVSVGALAGVNITAIAAANTNAGTAYALGADGIVRAWGYGYDGQLGNGISGSGSDGQPYYSGTPVQVSNLNDATLIGAHFGGGFAMRGDGTVVSWGSGRSGVLGDGDSQSSAVPVVVSGLMHVKMIGGGLTAYAVVGTPPPPSNVDTYVALGDSYSSGEGAPNPGYLAGTDTERNQCHRSSGAFSEIINPQTRLPFHTFRACSGALLRDFTHKNNDNDFEPKQLSWLNEKTGLVTFTIGGNNIGFAEVMKYCALRTAKKALCEEKYAASVAAAIERLAGPATDGGTTLAAIFGRIRSAAPNALVLVVGYPRLFPASPPDACDTGALARNFVRSDMLWINKAARDLDDVLRGAAANAGFTFVDTYDAFDGHEICRADSFANKAIVSPRESVVRWSFHPNLAGQNAIADIVLAHM